MSSLKVCVLFSVFLSLMMSLAFIGHVNAWLEYPEGKNYCLKFDGDNDYIGFSGLEAQQFTIEFWVKPNLTIQAGSDLEYGHEKGFLISVGTTILGYFNYKSGNLHLDLYIKRRGYVSYRYVNYAGSTHVWEPLWYHIAIVHDGSTLTCYVNASVDLVATIGQDLGYTYDLQYYSAAGRIGTAINDTSLAFEGCIDEIRFWNISRSSGEIIQAFNRTLGGTEINSPNLIGYWRLDDDANATLGHDFSLRKIDAPLGGSPSTPEWQIVPEFPSAIILPLFFIVTLLAVIVHRRKQAQKE